MASLTEIPARSTGSSGISYQKLLDTDTRPVPDVLRWESARELPAAVVPIERYRSQDFHDLEVEKVWKKVWHDSYMMTFQAQYCNGDIVTDDNSLINTPCQNEHIATFLKPLPMRPVN